MTLRRRKFTRSFKLMVLAQAETAKSIAEVAKIYEIAPQIVLRWRRELEANPDRAFTGETRSGEERRIAELERKIGQLTMENDLLKKALLRLEEQRRLRSDGTEHGSTS